MDQSSAATRSLAIPASHPLVQAVKSSAEFMRDYVSSAITHSKLCDQQFLDGLLSCLKAISNSYILDATPCLDTVPGGTHLRTPLLSARQELLAVILEECDRLHQYPSLFQTAGSRKRFFDKVYEHAFQIKFTTAMKQDAQQLFLDELWDLSQDTLPEARPPFEEDLDSWSQFLSNMAPGGGILAATRPTARPDHPFEYALQVLPRGGQHLVREWISAFRKAQKKAYEATPEQNVPRLMAVGYPWVIGREYKGLYSQYRFLNSSRMRPNPFNMEGVMENDLDVVGLAKTLEIVRANHKGSPMWLRNLDAQLFPHVFTFTEVKTRVRKWPENGQ